MVRVLKRGGAVEQKEMSRAWCLAAYHEIEGIADALSINV